MAKKDDIDFSAAIDQEAARAPAISADETYRQIGFALNQSADDALARLVLDRKQATGDKDISTTSLMVEAINDLFAKYDIKATATVRPRGRRY